MIPDTLSSSGASVILAETECQLPAWNEPSTLQGLTDMYNVENKIAGRTAGTTLYLVQAKGRNGELHEVQDEQKFKLFLVHAPTIVQDCNSQISNL